LEGKTADCGETESKEDTDVMQSEKG